MKNISDKAKKRLTITGCLAICVVLVVLIGQQFKTDKPMDDPLPPQSSSVSDVTVDPNAPDNAEKEKDVVIQLPDTTQPTSSDNGAVDKGTDQTIQGDVTKPEYTDEQLKKLDQKPNGDPVTETDKVQDHDKVEKPKDPPAPSKPSGGNSIPGFDNVPDGGANQGERLDDMYENGNKIGIMD